jgi:hypothetical protein
LFSIRLDEGICNAKAEKRCNADNIVKALLSTMLSALHRFAPFRTASHRFAEDFVLAVRMHLLLHFSALRTDTEDTIRPQRGKVEKWTSWHSTMSSIRPPLRSK